MATMRCMTKKVQADSIICKSRRDAQRAASAVLLCLSILGLAGCTAQTTRQFHQAISNNVQITSRIPTNHGVVAVERIVRPSGGQLTYLLVENRALDLDDWTNFRPYGRIESVDPDRRPEFSSVLVRARSKVCDEETALLFFDSRRYVFQPLPVCGANYTLEQSGGVAVIVGRRGNDSARFRITGFGQLAALDTSGPPQPQPQTAPPQMQESAPTTATPSPDPRRGPPPRTPQAPQTATPPGSRPTTPPTVQAPATPSVPDRTAWQLPRSRDSDFGTASERPRYDVEQERR
jgi:hypothetical protein